MVLMVLSGLMVLGELVLQLELQAQWAVWMEESWWRMEEGCWLLLAAVMELLLVGVWVVNWDQQREFGAEQLRVEERLYRWREQL